MEVKTISRLGETNTNKYGTVMKIIEYNKNSDIVVEFQDEHKAKVHTTYTNFTRSQVRNPYDKTVYDVGYLGEGKYKVYIDQEHLEPVYNVWRTLLGRVCTEKHRKRFPAYADCKVCDEWLCYQNFAEWWNENMYHIGNERMHLDKDILVKGNKFYSPDTCLIVPQRINMLFLQKPNKYNLPSGISPMANNRYRAEYNGKKVGNYDTLEEAIQAHDNEKRKAIKKVADEYKQVIPDKVYKALLEW